MKGSHSLRKAGRRLAVLLVVGAAALVVAPFAFADATITSSGPLTSILITSDLNCDVQHSGDTAPEFYAGTACGTFLAVGGTLYGPASVPAGGSAAPRTAWTPVSQTPVTGSGTSGDPYKIVTVVAAGTTGVRLTETDTYIVGQESYRTDVTVSNTGASGVSGVVYHAGDCYLQSSDYGYGHYDSSTGAISCVATSGRIEQFYPLSSGSHYTETFYNTMWGQIGSQSNFPDSCDCTSYEDNSAGLSWSISVPAGQSVSRSLLTTFSPLGIEPLTTTKTADSGSASSGGSDGYTIKIHNPNAGDASIDSITDTLPAGFSYQSGTTSGATTSNPSISGQNLSWSGPFTVPGNGDVSLHFDVTVATANGTYYNNAGGTSSSYTIAPTGDTAPVVVSASGPPPDTTPPSCMLTGVIIGPPKAIQVTVQDTGSGLASIQVVTSSNATTVVDPFSPGDTSPVVVLSTKTDQTKSSSLALTVKDVAGNVTHCDPVWGGKKRTAARPHRSHHLRVHTGQFARLAREEEM